MLSIYRLKNISCSLLIIRDTQWLGQIPAGGMSQEFLVIPAEASPLMADV